MADENEFDWICSTTDVEGGERVQLGPTVILPAGIAARAKLWKRDTTLGVRFLGGTKPLHDRVLAAARQWLVDGVRLKIVAAAAGEHAELRVAFDANGGSWSYIGTDAETIQAAQPTMNLGWATLETPERAFNSVVIHEFGHALGLLHEHNHPEARIDWDKDAVYGDLAAAPNCWSRAKVDHNVFTSYDESNLITTRFDDVSVMIYTIPSRWTRDGKRFMPSSQLSAGDRATILKLYA